MRCGLRPSPAPCRPNSSDRLGIKITSSHVSTAVVGRSGQPTSRSGRPRDRSLRDRSAVEHVGKEIGPMPDASACLRLIAYAENDV